MRLQSHRDPQILNLIYAVSQRAELYDYRLPDYHNEKLKEEIWQQIAIKCGMESAKEAKAYWKQLHHSFNIFYRNELLRLVRTNYDESSTGPLPDELRDDNVNDRLRNKTWCYYSDMRFIAPFRSKGTDPELERLIELAKPIVYGSSSASSMKADNSSTTTTAMKEKTTTSKTLTKPKSTRTTKTENSTITATLRTEMETPLATITCSEDFKEQQTLFHLNVPPLSSAEVAKENGALST